MNETRDVTVGSALQHHQLASYLRAAGIEFTTVIKDLRLRSVTGSGGPNFEVKDSAYRITATPGQWVKVDEWIERIKEGR